MRRTHPPHPPLAPHPPFPPPRRRLDDIVPPPRLTHPPPKEQHRPGEDAGDLARAAGAIPRHALHPHGAREARVDEGVVCVCGARRDREGRDRSVEDGLHELEDVADLSRTRWEWCETKRK